MVVVVVVVVVPCLKLGKGYTSLLKGQEKEIFNSIIYPSARRKVAPAETMIESEADHERKPLARALGLTGHRDALTEEINRCVGTSGLLRSKYNSYCSKLGLRSSYLGWNKVLNLRMMMMIICITTSNHLFGWYVMKNGVCLFVCLFSPNHIPISGLSWHIQPVNGLAWLLMEGTWFIYITKTGWIWKCGSLVLIRWGWDHIVIIVIIVMRFGCVFWRVRMTGKQDFYTCGREREGGLWRVKLHPV